MLTPFKLTFEMMICVRLPQHTLHLVKAGFHLTGNAEYNVR